MNNEELILLGTLLTALVTIVGWLYTASVQQQILKETKNIQSINREIEVFRKRLETVNKINSSLLDQSMIYTEYYSRIISNQFDFESIRKLHQRLIESAPEMHRTLFDPKYRSILYILPENIAQKIHSTLTDTLNSTADFHTSLIGISPLDPKLNERLTVAAQQALILSRKLVNVAGLLADTFATLDESLATENITPHSKKTKGFEWLDKIPSKDD